MAPSKFERHALLNLKGILVCRDRLSSSIVIVNSKLLKRHSKAKRRAPAYSRALRQIRRVFQRIVRGKLRSGCQGVRGLRGGRLGVKAGVV